MNAKEHAKRLRDLQALLIEFLKIERYIYLPEHAGKDRKETDTEHSYNLAMFAWYLSQNYPELDRDLVIRYALVHDLVEIHAGDVLAVGRTKAQQKKKEKRERQALEKLKTDWPDFEDMTKTIENYEKQADAESIFIKTLDKIVTVFMNLEAKGKIWKVLDLHRNDVIKHHDNASETDEGINAIWQELRKEMLAHDEFFNEGKR